jgi:hypothetical protein
VCGGGRRTQQTLTPAMHRMFTLATDIRQR